MISPEEALKTLADFYKPVASKLSALPLESIIEFGARKFYVPETRAPIKFERHQKIILRMMFDPAEAAALGVANGFQTLIYSTVKKSGKALALDTPIPTPALDGIGWLPLSSVAVGTKLFDDRGVITTVTHVTLPMYDHDCYNITFSDGATIVADGDHLWTGSTPSANAITITTRAILNLLRKGVLFTITGGLASAASATSAKRYVVSITPTLSVPVRCIQVDSPTALYLVGLTAIPTHNTTIASLVARYVTENWGAFNEIYTVANNYEQAKGRVYEGVVRSIQLDPNYDPQKDVLPGVWKVNQHEALHLPSKSTLRAVSSNYKGEAGSNPTGTFWSEIWGFSLEQSRRLWDELTPVPTRPRSIRFVETYAGFENESELLIELYELATRYGRRLTLNEVPDWPWPAQKIPLFINPAARLLAYWDEGEEARRMPWHTPEYYQAQALTLRSESFNRLHNNFWTSSVNSFVPIEWWNACASPANQITFTNKTPLVVGADASVSGDCTGLVAVSRYASGDPRTVLQFSRVWTPTPGIPLNYSYTIEPTLRQWVTGHIHPLNEPCATHSLAYALGPCIPQAPYNIVQIAYDAYQLHDLMTRFRNEGLVWTRPFSQGTDRMTADKQLYDNIRDRTIFHHGDLDVSQHIQNAAAKIPKSEDTKLRIVKKADKSKIDLAVALSMANYECKRLML